MSEHSIRDGVLHAVENVAETLKEGTAAAVGKEAHLGKSSSHGANVARDVMSTNVECARTTDSVASVARRLTELNIGSMPICGEDGLLHGMITDRDIVTKVVAKGFDPAATFVGEITEDRIVTVDVDDLLADVLRTMSENHVRRVPVLENRRLVGIVAQADLSRTMTHSMVGELVEQVSTP